MTKRAIFGQALSWKRRRFKCKGTFFSCRTRFPKCRQTYRKRFGTVAVMGRRQLCQAKGYVNEQSVSDNRIVTANATGYPKAVMSFVDKYYSPHRHSPKSYQIPTKVVPKSFQVRLLRNELGTTLQAISIGIFYCCRSVGFCLCILSFFSCQGMNLYFG